jgi:hypothetical protein
MYLLYFLWNSLVMILIEQTLIEFHLLSGQLFCECKTANLSDETVALSGTACHCLMHDIVEEWWQPKFQGRVTGPYSWALEKRKYRFRVYKICQC